MVAQAGSSLRPEIFANGNGQSRTTWGQAAGGLSSPVSITASTSDERMAPSLLKGQARISWQRSLLTYSMGRHSSLPEKQGPCRVRARLSQHGNNSKTGAEQGILTESNPILQRSPDLPRVPVGVVCHRGALAREDHGRPILIIAGPSTPRIPRRVARMRKPGPGGHHGSRHGLDLRSRAKERRNSIGAKHQSDVERVTGPEGAAQDRGTIIHAIDKRRSVARLRLGERKGRYTEQVIAEDGAPAVKR